MSAKNWVGIVLAAGVFALFGFFMHRGCDLTSVWAFAFGGGLLFAGLLIDPAEFQAVFRLWKGTPTP